MQMAEQRMPSDFKFLKLAVHFKYNHLLAGLQKAWKEEKQEKEEGKERKKLTVMVFLFIHSASSLDSVHAKHPEAGGGGRRKGCSVT